MALADEVAGLDEVAAALGRSPVWLQRNWLKLHQTQNFPRKIPTGWVWPRRAVEVWLRSAGQVARPLPANDDGAGDPVEAAAAALKQRYGALQ
jgi:predicted DNA-binding transcriptional regulator AlpA